MAGARVADLAPPARATSARHVVLALTLLLAGIVYLDRVAISTTSPAIEKELGLDDVQLGLVFSAYTLAYALFEVPSGWLADRFGARVMLTRIVVGWSIMTAATGFAWGFASLCLIRFVFGSAEAGAFPSIARVYGRWLPARQRARAFGLAVMCGLLASAATQPLVVALMGAMSWRQVFPLFGLVGLVWALVWFAWFRDDPHAHPSVAPAELAIIGTEPEPPHTPVRWGDLLGNRSLRALCAMYLGTIYGWYFFLSWLPQYLLRARGFDLRQVGWLSALPLVGIASGVLSGGWLSDVLTRRVGMRWGRRLPGLVGLPVAACAIVAAVVTANARVSVAALALAAASAALAVAPAWAVCLDIGARHAGVVSGAMNTFGNLGGTLSPVVMGFCLTRWHSWNLPLLSLSFFYVLAGACWLLIDPLDKLRDA
jgi:ACS family glucarate transporter-like MFS transporter